MTIARQSLFGVVAHHIPFPSYTLYPEDFDRFASIGLDAIVLDVCWRLVEPQPDQWDFRYYDFIFAQAKAHHLKVLAKLGNGYNGNRPTVPDWTKTLSVEAYNARLAYYGAKIAQRYGHAVFAFALENEANIAALHLQGGWRQGLWPKERVMSIWQTLAQTLAKEAPDVETILTLAAVENWEDWAKEAMAKFSFDAIGLQIYPCGTDPDPNRVGDAKQELQKAADLARTLSITETGYHTFMRPEEKQAYYVEKMATLCWQEGAKGIFFYEYLDGPEEPELEVLGDKNLGQEQHFGLCHNSGQSESRLPKPAWHAYGKVIATLRQAKSPR